MKNTGEKCIQLMNEQKAKWIKSALSTIFLFVR